MSDATGRDRPIIEVAGVEKVYDDGMVHALRGVDLTVARGEILAITGPSGCGKSTLLHLLAALDRPTAGTITVDGRDLTRLRHPDAYRRQEIGLIFQLHNLLPRLTALGNVEIAMAGTRRHIAERTTHARELLADVHLGSSPTAIRPSCPVANVSGSPSPGHWPTTHPSCWPTSPREASTATRCAPSSISSPPCATTRG